MPVAVRSQTNPKTPPLPRSWQKHALAFDATRALLRLLHAAPLSAPQLEGLVAASGRLASAAGLELRLVARAQFEALHDVALPDYSQSPDEDA